jgi:hypothetical protein
MLMPGAISNSLRSCSLMENKFGCLFGNQDAINFPP